jgi:hypothetical protein
MTRARDIANLGNGVDASDLTEGAVEGALTTPTGRRNLIINGAMQVAQRGTGTSSSNPNEYVFYDRFRPTRTGTYNAAYTVGTSTDAPDGFANSFLVTCTGSSLGSDQAMGIIYKAEVQDIEQFNFYSVNSLPATLSFYVKANHTGTYNVNLSVSGTSVTKTFVSEFTINSANTWERKTISVPTGCGASGKNGNSDDGLFLSINLSGSGNRFVTSVTTDIWQTQDNRTTYLTTNCDEFTSSVGNTIQFTGVQLEVGSVATPFEHRSYGEELALCERYYQVLNTQAGENFAGIAYSTDGCRFPISFRKEMRTSPTVTIPTIGQSTGQMMPLSSGLGWPANFGSGTRSVAALNNQRFHISYENFTSSFTQGDCVLLYSTSNNTKITLDAEL